jgi:hypothetical protein
LGPVVYLLYTSDIPTTAETTIDTFADDTIILLSSHEHPETASKQLQHDLNLLDQWAKRLKIKINDSKSTQITFALKRCQCSPMSINNAIIPESTSVRYLGIQLDKKLNWKEHIVIKRKHIDVIKKLSWLLKRKSHLNLENKILLYKVAKNPYGPMGLSYGAVLARRASTSHKGFSRRYSEQ